MPERIQLSRARGWRLPENTVKVDRTTIWGNPFHTHGDGRRMENGLAVSLFRSMIEKTGGWMANVRGGQISVDRADVVRELRGKNLACWCKPGEQCHADVLLELANAPEGDEPRKALWAKCPSCRHCWPAAYYPLELSVMARVLKGTVCPKGCTTPALLAKQEDGELQEPTT